MTDPTREREIARSTPPKAVRETEWQRRTRRERERDAHIALHGNACELCGNAPKSRGLSEDHDHKTGEHRGWLCHRCNRALPTWVNVTWLLAAARYLGATWEQFRDAAPEPKRRAS